MKNFRVFYHKTYSGMDENNPKKHTLTQDQVESIISMLNGAIEDVDIAIKILSNSNCNQYYDDIIWGALKGRNWIQKTSKDGINKRITRFF